MPSLWNSITFAVDVLQLCGASAPTVLSPCYRLLLWSRTICVGASQEKGHWVAQMISMGEAKESGGKAGI